jgi:hypothetical protein
MDSSRIQNSRNSARSQKHKTSKNASSLLLLYIPLPQRRVPRRIGVRQSKKERKMKISKKNENRKV